MSVDTLCDFFMFISSNKKTISNKNLNDFYQFIETKYQLFDEKRKESFGFNKSKSLLNDLETFLNDFLLFFYNKSLFVINKSQEKIIKNNIEKKQNIEKLKDQQILEEKKNSYQYQYRKSLTHKKINENETKKCLLNFLLNDELNINICPEKYILFFTENEKYRLIIHKFFLKMRPLIEKKAKKLLNIQKMNKKSLSNPIENYKKIKNNNEINQISEKESLIENKNQFIKILNRVKVKVCKTKEEIPKPTLNRKKTFENKNECSIGEDDIQINIDDNNLIKNKSKKLIKINNPKIKINNKKRLSNEKLGIFHDNDYFNKRDPRTPDNKSKDINYAMFGKSDFSKKIKFDDVIKKVDKSADDIGFDSKSMRNNKIKHNDKFIKNEDQIQCGCYLF